MSWNIKVNASGLYDETDVDGANVIEAITLGLTELGWDENDEASMTIEISGAAD